MADGTLAFFGAGMVIALLFFERIGSMARNKADKLGANTASHHDRIAHILTSTFGLLALLIGFTFSIALNRFDTRRNDVVLEANAISTAHYRAGLVDPQYGKPLRDSLVEYASYRLSYGEAGPIERKQKAVGSAELRNRIAEAGMSIRPIVQTPLGTSIVASVNDVLDLGVQREANMAARIPWTVFAVLIGLACVASAIMGFAHPLSGKLRQSSSLMLFLLLTITIIVILDLDRPARGSITVDQGPMKQLSEDFKSASAN